MSRVAVFGAGSWGTAFSLVLADAGNDVTMWGRREEVCAAITESHENPDYLPDIKLPDTVTATHDPAAAVDGAEAIIFAVPVPVVPREPRRLGTRAARGAAGLADEGCRAREPQADE